MSTTEQDLVKKLQDNFADPQDGLKVLRRRVRVSLVVLGTLGIGFASVLSIWPFMIVAGSVVVLCAFLEHCVNLAVKHVTTLLK